MVLRRTGCGVLEAERHFRKVAGYRALLKLVLAPGSCPYRQSSVRDLSRDHALVSNAFGHTQFPLA